MTLCGFHATDIFAFRSYLAVLVLFGRHCLFAYMALHVPFKDGFDALANAVTAGIAVHFGKGVQSFCATVFVCCALVFAVKIRDVLQKTDFIEKGDAVRYRYTWTVVNGLLHYDWPDLLK